MEVDERYGFILSAFLQVSKRQTKLSADTIWDMFLDDLEGNGVWDTSVHKESTWDGRTGEGGRPGGGQGGRGGQGRGVGGREGDWRGGQGEGG